MTTGRTPNGRVMAALSVAFVALCLYPHALRLRRPSLYTDDVVRIADLRSGPLSARLFRPFNEHMAPLFETVSWLAWRGCGRRIQAIPTAFRVASMVAFGVTVGLLAALIRREVRSATAAMAGVARADLAVPEIDPGTAGSALTLLAGGLLILKDRLRGK